MGHLFLLFVSIPVLEIWVLVRVGQAVGTLPTIALVILTAAIGSTLARREGARAMQTYFESSSRGEIPTAAMANGLAVFLGGAMLLTPGFVTDAFGLSLLLPWTRQLMLTGVTRWVRYQMAHGKIKFQTPPGVGFQNEGFSQQGFQQGQPFDQHFKHQSSGSNSDEKIVDQQFDTPDKR
ncbi:FxsA family protein [Myxococcota bacterium]|nr:FxsA family protein [Myxococcota bacterium]